MNRAYHVFLDLVLATKSWGLSRWLNDKESTCQYRRCRFDPWVGKIPWRRKWQPTPVFLLGQSPIDRGAWQAAVHEVAESDMTERPNNNNRLKKNKKNRVV